MLVSSDLQARVRAETAVGQHGLALRTRRPGDREPLDPDTEVVIVDLDQVDDVAAWLAAAQPGGRRVVGFFSHVRTDAGAAARAAGVEVYPRGRFWRELNDLLTRDV